MRSLRGHGERGSILVEAVFLLVLLTLPVFYLVGTLARVQAGVYAVSAAAREAGRAYVTSADEASAPGRAWIASNLVFNAHGFTGDEGSVQVSCATSQCLAPGGQVSIDASVSVELPLVPDFMDGVLPTTVELTASHLEPVDQFREASP